MGKAAALMRERAEKAEPGRWKLWGMSVLADPKGTSDVEDGIPVAVAATPSTSSRRLHTGNAEHIASWHPAVALAVADWLDATARELDSLGDPDLTGHPLDGRRTAALAVARAYLGDE